MKITQSKDAFRNIKKRIVSFLSLCLVVALGLGCLFTTRYMGAGLEQEISDYYTDRNFKNYEIMASMGMSERSLNKIRSLDEVTAAEGVIRADISVTHESKKLPATLVTLTKQVSVPKIKTGEYPKGRNECIIGEDFAKKEGLKIGDKVKLSVSGLDASESSSDLQKLKEDAELNTGDEASDGSSDELSDKTSDKKSEDNYGKSPLYDDEFTIVGLMYHPDYLRRNTVNTITLPMDAFDKDVTDGLYTAAFIKAKDPEGISPFSDKYANETRGIRKKIEALTSELEDERTNEVKEEAYDYIDEEWDKAVKQLDSAQDEIDAGEAELDARLADGRNRLYDAENTLNREVGKYNEKIADGEKQLKDAEEELNNAKKLYKEASKTFNTEKKQLEDALETVNYLLDNYADDNIRETDEYKKEERQLADTVVNNEDSLVAIGALSKDKAIRKKIKEIDKKYDSDIMESVDVIAAMYPKAISEVIEQSKQIQDGTREHYDKGVLSDIKTLILEVMKIQSGLDKTEKRLKKAEKDLAAKKKELKDGKATLQKKKAEGKRKIEQGWATYYAEKAKYESKLEEAKALLEENREEAEKKLEEAKADVENINPCICIDLDRGGNAGYVDARNSLNAIRSAGNIFGVLFMIVTAIVCLSTLIIIIDEQKHLVGTTKAFGFHKKEILGKYLAFGISAAVVGSILSVLLGLAISNFMQGRIASTAVYQVGKAPTIFTPRITVIAAVIITVVAIAATILACSDILKSPASILMKGGTSKKKKTGKEKKTSSKGTSLYSKLIIRNMLQDKARVLVTTAIIAFCCMLIGAGISLKLAFDGMMDRQESDVNRYDFRMDLNNGIEDAEKAKLASAVDSSGVSYVPATVTTLLYNWNGKLDGLQMICGDADKLGEFYAVEDPKTNEAVTIPDDGILIQKRMHESYDMDVGDKLPILDTSLVTHEAEIKGLYTNYVGRAVVASPEAYKKIFGKENEINSYYIKLNGVDEKEFKNAMLAASSDISFVDRDEFKSRFESVTMLYNLIVIIITGMAVLISFMILTNLSNIFLNRKKTELSVMRVNGFSIKQAKSYLTRETIITTIAGLILGVIVGAIFTPRIITMIQQEDVEYVNIFHTVAWLTAVGIEGSFAVLINSIVFNKVKNLDLRDIAS